jgi:hypothetical protein
VIPCGAIIWFNAHNRGGKKAIVPKIYVQNKIKTNFK